MNDSDIRARTSHRPRRAVRVGASLAVVAVGAGAFFALRGGDSATALSDTADGDAVVSTTYCEPGVLGSWEVHGTIKNTSGSRHRFRVDARYFRGGKLLDGHGGTTRPLAAGRTQDFRIGGNLGFFNEGSGKPRCEVVAAVVSR